MTQADLEARQKAVDAFFAERQGWSRFNYERWFLDGWDLRMAGRGGYCGSIAYTTERVVVTAGRKAAARYITERA